MRSRTIIILDFERAEVFVYPIEDGRRCTCCDRPMDKGYCVRGGEEYYCDTDCLYRHYTPQQWKEMHKEGESDSYWTEWASHHEELLQSLGHNPDACQWMTQEEAKINFIVN